MIVRKELTTCREPINKLRFFFIIKNQHVAPTNARHSRKIVLFCKYIFAVEKFEAII